MLNKIMNSPYVLGALLTAIHLVFRAYTGTFATILGSICPLLFIALYTYLTQLNFSKNFKYLTMLTTFITGIAIDQLLFGKISNALSEMGQAHPAALIITLTLVVLVGCGINYLYLFLGNQLGLWLLKKNK